MERIQETKEGHDSNWTSEKYKGGRAEALIETSEPQAWSPKVQPCESTIVI